MAIVSSGEVKLSDLATEFGGSAPHQMSEYYAGGSNVPSGTGSVPSSGQISLTQFYGTTAIVILYEANVTAIVNFQKNTYQQIQYYSATTTQVIDLIPSSPSPQVIANGSYDPTSGPGTSMKFRMTASSAWDPIATPNSPKFGLLGAHFNTNYVNAKFIHASPDDVRQNVFPVQQTQNSNWQFNPLAQTSYLGNSRPYFDITCSGTNATSPYSIPFKTKLVPGNAPNTY